MRRPWNISPWRWPVTVLGVAAAYILAARFGLSFAQIAPQVTPVWPPTGIALAALILLGPRTWPGIALGALLANIWGNRLAGMDWADSLWVAAGIATGNTLEAVVGAGLLRLTGFRPDLRRVRDVAALVFIGALLSTAISATTGVATLALHDPANRSSFGHLWWTWWLGDAMGDLMIAPVLLTLCCRPPVLNVRVQETTAFFGALLAVNILVLLAVFDHPAQLSYLVFPLFAWSALRLSQGVTAVALVIVSATAVYGATAPGHAHGESLNQRLLLLETFMGVLAATSLATGAATAERRAAERALRDREEQLRLATEASDVGVWTRDLATDAVNWNPMLESIFGLPPGGFGGSLRSFRALIHPDDREMVDRCVNDAIREHREYEIEFRFFKGAELRWMIGRGRAYYDEDGRPVRLAGVGFDVTDRKHVEEELFRYREHLEELVKSRTAELEASHERLRLSERMAALGTLAAGLGHDMGNLLLPIQARLDVLRARESSPETADDLRAIAQCAQYLVSLARGLRALARDPGSAKGVTNLSAWWTDAGPFLQNVLAKPLMIDAQIPHDLPPVAISSERLTQAIFNIINNAREAIVPSRDGPRSTTVELAATRHGEQVRLCVTDHGPGMPEEVRRRCLEPFFTTKTRGISTGLGLSLVHGIATDAGGAVHVESERGTGTTVCLVLPLTQTSRPHDRPIAWVTVSESRSGAMTCRVLEAMGFEVARSQRPHSPRLWITDATPEALTLARTNPLSCQLIVLGASNGDWHDLGGLVVETPTPSAIRTAITEVMGDHDPHVG